MIGNERLGGCGDARPCRRTAPVAKQDEEILAAIKSAASGAGRTTPQTLP